MEYPAAFTIIIVNSKKTIKLLSLYLLLNFCYPLTNQ
uniref:Uncharacterized protein n=1 Tax=Medicago truncatula TaxID=3880 RepID=I3SAQ7_MEDTR|nr:unknown [Medicago truncatula]